MIFFPNNFNKYLAISKNIIISRLVKFKLQFFKLAAFPKTVTHPATAPKFTFLQEKYIITYPRENKYVVHYFYFKLLVRTDVK